MLCRRTHLEEMGEREWSYDLVGDLVPEFDLGHDAFSWISSGEAKSCSAPALRRR